MIQAMQGEAHFQFTLGLIPTKTVFKACLQRLEHFSQKICYWADPNTEVREGGRDRGQERQQVVDQQICLVLRGGRLNEEDTRKILMRKQKDFSIREVGQVLRKWMLSPNRWWRLQFLPPSTESFLLVLVCFTLG